MALQTISIDATPSYIALSTDIVGGTIDGVSLIGRLVYTTDDGKWYIVEKDLSLSPYVGSSAGGGTIGENVNARLNTLQNDGLTYAPTTVQNPIPTDGDSIYEKDVDESNSDNGNFTNSVIDLFNNLKSINTDTTSNNPKIIKIWFKRTIQAHSIGFGCDDNTGSFSNIVVKLLGSSNVIRYEHDSSTDDEKRNTFLVDMPLVAFNGIQLEFHTADPVCLSNLIVFKAIDTHSTISAVRADGTVGDIQATNRGNFEVAIQEYGDTPSIDAFARLRVSNPHTLFDSKQLHDKQPLFWSELINGGTSVHSVVNANVTMTVNTTGNSVIRQTKQRFNYQPGKSQLVLLTFRMPSAIGIKQRIGIFDSNDSPNYLTPYNGIFLTNDEGELSWNIAKNGVITETVIQSDWNVDTLDGLGYSELGLDMDACQIAIIDYEWLGVGRVRVGFVIDGIITYCHYFNHANMPTYDSVYMSTPNLPVRYDIQATSIGAGVLEHICSTVMSEGGIEQTGILHSVDSGSTPVNCGVAGTIYPIIGVRLKNLYKDVTVIPEFFSMLATTSDDYRWSVHLNPTLTTGLTYSDVTNSALQVGRGLSSISMSNQGLVIDSGYNTGGFNGAIQRKFVTSLRMGSTINGVMDRVILAVTPLSPNLSILGSLTVRELL